MLLFPARSSTTPLNSGAMIFLTFPSPHPAPCLHPPQRGHREPAGERGACMRAVAPRIRVPCATEAQAHLGAPGGQQEESGAQQDGRAAQSHGCLCPLLAFALHFILRCGAATCLLVLHGEAVPVHPALHWDTCTSPCTTAAAPCCALLGCVRRWVSSTEGGRRCFKKGIGRQQDIEMVRPCGPVLCGSHPKPQGGDGGHAAF